jgi:hypothetical protein
MATFGTHTGTVAESSPKPHRRDPELAGSGEERKGPEQAWQKRAWTVWTPARGFSRVLGTTALLTCGELMPPVFVISDDQAN